MDQQESRSDGIRSTLRGILRRQHQLSLSWSEDDPSNLALFKRYGAQSVEHLMMNSPLVRLGSSSAASHADDLAAVQRAALSPDDSENGSTLARIVDHHTRLEGDSLRMVLYWMEQDKARVDFYLLAYSLRAEMHAGSYEAGRFLFWLLMAMLREGTHLEYDAEELVKQVDLVFFNMTRYDPSAVRVREYYELMKLFYEDRGTSVVINSVWAELNRSDGDETHAMKLWGPFDAQRRFNRDERMIMNDIFRTYERTRRNDTGMDEAMSISSAAHSTSTNTFALTGHAKQRMAERNIDHGQVSMTMQYGSRVSKYDTDGAKSYVKTFPTGDGRTETNIHYSKSRDGEARIWTTYEKAKKTPNEQSRKRRNMSYPVLMQSILEDLMAVSSQDNAGFLSALEGTIPDIYLSNPELLQELLSVLLVSAPTFGFMSNVLQLIEKHRVTIPEKLVRNFKLVPRQ